MNSMNILLVDDDLFLRDMYASKFVEGGHKVDAVSNGEEGLSRIKDGDIDVVLLDMVMPGMTGLDFLKKAKEDKATENIKFVVLSNQGEESDQEAARKAGAAGYIIKAESIPSDVVKKVQALVGESKK